MSKLVPNEYYQYYKYRLPDIYLNSFDIYMTRTIYRELNQDFADYCILNAISEAQFSLGARNQIGMLFDEACPLKDKPYHQVIKNLRPLIARWLVAIDDTKAVID